jgi:acyl transferase domain-containing protein/phosphopantetheinyl transferase
VNRESCDVAIIGMACVFPEAPDLAAYWRNIVDKVDAVGEPPDGWYVEPVGLAGPDADGEAIYTRRGGYLRNLARFDPLEYGVMPTSVGGGDPDQFLALRVAHEALADAGYLDRRGDPAGVEVILGKGTPVNPGNTNLLQHSILIDQTLRILRQLHPEHTDAELSEIRRQLKASLPPLTAETVPALVPNVLTGRIANRLDLMGVNYTVDAACASSLIAVERGMDDLRAGRCELALVGGVQASTAPPVLYAFCRLNALSRGGRIRPFSKDADGTLLGEGVGMVVLKRRQDAERDGDRIYALLKGIGTASDGRAQGLLTPRVEGQALALRRAYEAAGIPPDSVELIEAHGTGTLVGDVTEIKALNQVFGPRNGTRCAVGTVKSMISHLVPAAGIAGLIKTALALHHRVLPPTLCDEPSPRLELESTPFYINTETRPWIHGDATPRRAGVSAFGFGGINVHAILEEHPGSAVGHPPALLDRWDTEVLILRGESRQQLSTQARRLTDLLSRGPDVALADLAFTVNCPLAERGCRLAIVADTVGDLDRKLSDALHRLADPGCRTIRDRRGIYFNEQPAGGAVAFLFPGEGSQYPNMLSDLCLHFPEVRSAFDRADRVLGADGSGARLRHVLFPFPSPRPGTDTAASPALWQMDLAVSAVLAADHGVLALLQELSLSPDAVAGHSSGEFAALVASGAIAIRNEDQVLQHSLRLKAAYDEVADQVPSATLLTVGGVDLGAVRELIAASNGLLHLAMDNCPHQVILCGTGDSGSWALRRLQEMGGICSSLPFGRAYHTELFRPVADRLAAFYDTLEVTEPRVPIYSCATADRYPADLSQIRSLAAAQWARPVRFRQTIEAMYDSGHRIFIEVGAKATLTGFVDDILRGRPHLAVAADPPGRSGIAALNHLVGLLAAHGAPMRLDRLYKRRACRRVELDDGFFPTSGPSGVELALNLPLQRLPAPSAAPEPPSAPTGIRGQPTPVEPLPEPVAAPQVSRTVPVSAPTVPTPYRTSARARAMSHYSSTMERFLDVERQVVTTALTGGSPPPPPSPVPPSSAGGDTGAAFAPGVATLNVSSLDPGRRLVATCRLDPTVHHYLRDHALGRRPSDRDPDLSALPVVPLTVSVEILAEAAANLLPGRRFIGMRAVRAHRWIAVEEGPRLLTVTAECSAPGERVTVRIVEDDRKPQAADHQTLVEGTAVFAADYPAPPAPLRSTASSAPPYPLDRDEYYRITFHGPVFHSVDTIGGCDATGIDAVLRVPMEPGLLSARPGRALRTDPVLLDGATQVVGFWARSRLDRGYAIFPIGISALDLYGELPPPGTPVACSARINLLGTDRISADIDLSYPDGAVIARLSGLGYLRLLDWSPRFIDFALDPPSAMLSVPWPAPVSTIGGTARCCRILRAETGVGSWPRILASLILSRRERATWSRMEASETRRRDWLLGRLVAKDAVRLLLKDRHDIQLAAADIDIEADEHGRPRVAEPLQRDLGLEVVISLSHTGGDAVAVAAESGGRLGIGVDMEHLRDRHSGFADAAFDQQECALLEKLPSAGQSEWLLRLWCAKEAAGKALGTGLGGSPRNFAAHKVDQVGGTVWLRAPTKPASGREMEIVAHTGCEDGLVFASSMV